MDKLGLNPVIQWKGEHLEEMTIGELYDAEG